MLQLAAPQSFLIIPLTPLHHHRSCQCRIELVPHPTTGYRRIRSTRTKTQTTPAQAPAPTVGSDIHIAPRFSLLHHRFRIILDSTRCTQPLEDRRGSRGQQQSMEAITRQIHQCTPLTPSTYPVPLEDPRTNSARRAVRPSAMARGPCTAAPPTAAPGE